MVKLQVLLVPKYRKEVDSASLTQWGARKFIHLADGNSTLHQVCESLVKRYCKLYPDDDELEIFLVQDNDMCDLDPDYLVDEVLRPGDIIRVIASNSSRVSMMDHTMSDVTQSTPAATSFPKKPIAESTSHMDMESHILRQDLSSRPTIWNDRLSGNSSAPAIHVAKRRISTPKTRNSNTMLPSSLSSPSAQKLPTTSQFDQSMVSLPPPEEHDDRTIPQKRNNTVSTAELPTKRITSGMLTAPNNDAIADEIDKNTDLSSPKESIAHPSPTKLVDTSALSAIDVVMTENESSQNKIALEDEADSDSGSDMSKQEFMDMFKDLFSKQKAASQDNEANSQTNSQRASNLMKGLEIDMVDAKYPVLDPAKRSTRSSIRKQSTADVNNSKPLPSTERTIITPMGLQDNDKDSNKSTIPHVNIIQNGKGTTKFADATLTNGNGTLKVKHASPPKSKLASVFDKVKKFDAKLTSLNLPRNNEGLPPKSEQDAYEGQDINDSKIAESPSKASFSELSEESSSDESDLSLIANKSKPRLAAATPTSTAASLKSRAVRVPRKQENSIIGTLETPEKPQNKLEETVKSTQQSALAENDKKKSEHLEAKLEIILGIKRPILNSLTDLARRGVPSVVEASHIRKNVPEPEDNSESENDSSDSEMSSSSSSSSDNSDSASDSLSKKYITAKSLTASKKKKSRGGFAALMKDARKA